MKIIKKIRSYFKLGSYNKERKEYQLMAEMNLLQTKKYSTKQINHFGINSKYICCTYINKYFTNVNSTKNYTTIKHGSTSIKMFGLISNFEFYIKYLKKTIHNSLI